MVLCLVNHQCCIFLGAKTFQTVLGFHSLGACNIACLWILIVFIECAFGEGLHSGVANLDFLGGLWVPHLNEAGLQGDIILSIYVGGTYFGLVR